LTALTNLLRTFRKSTQFATYYTTRSLVTARRRHDQSAAAKLGRLVLGHFPTNVTSLLVKTTNDKRRRRKKGKEIEKNTKNESYTYKCTRIPISNSICSRCRFADWSSVQFACCREQAFTGTCPLSVCGHSHCVCVVKGFIVSPIIYSDRRRTHSLVHTECN